MFGLVEMGGGICAWSISRRWGRGHALGGDLCMVDFAEVGEGPPPP